MLSHLVQLFCQGNSKHGVTVHKITQSNIYTFASICITNREEQRKHYVICFITDAVTCSKLSMLHFLLHLDDFNTSSTLSNEISTSRQHRWLNSVIHIDETDRQVVSIEITFSVNGKGLLLYAMENGHVVILSLKTDKTSMRAFSVEILNHCTLLTTKNTYLQQLSMIPKNVCLSNSYICNIILWSEKDCSECNDAYRIRSSILEVTDHRTITFSLPMNIILGRSPYILRSVSPRYPLNKEDTWLVWIVCETEVNVYNLSTRRVITKKFDHHHNGKELLVYEGDIDRTMYIRRQCDDNKHITLSISLSDVNQLHFKSVPNDLSLDGLGMTRFNTNGIIDIDMSLKVDIQKANTKHMKNFPKFSLLPLPLPLPIKKPDLSFAVEVEEMRTQVLTRQEEELYYPFTLLYLVDPFDLLLFVSEPNLVDVIDVNVIPTVEGVHAPVEVESSLDSVSSVIAKKLSLFHDLCQHVFIENPTVLCEIILCIEEICIRQIESRYVKHVESEAVAVKTINDETFKDQIEEEGEENEVKVGVPLQLVPLYTVAGMVSWIPSPEDEDEGRDTTEEEEEEEGGEVDKEEDKDQEMNFIDATTSHKLETETGLSTPVIRSRDDHLLCHYVLTFPFMNDFTSLQSPAHCDPSSIHLTAVNQLKSVIESKLRELTC